MNNKQARLVSFLFLVLVAMAVWQCGCAIKMHQKPNRTETSASPSIGMVTPLAEAVPHGSSSPYRLGFGDVLEIRFFNNREFNVTVPVRPDGRVAIEKVGEIDVAGQTAAYVDSLITQAYARFMRDPEVTVIVCEFGSNHMYVLGEVNAPGKFAIQQDMTLLQALATAGGPKDTAKLNSVLLIRRGDQAQPVAVRIDLKTIHNRGHEPISLVVQPLDVIYVPRTFIADVSSFMKKFYDAFLPPVDAYLRALFYTRR